MSLHAHKACAAHLPALRLALRGDVILNNPRFNKGSAFTLQERKDFGLVGRLPFAVNTLDQQCERAHEQLKARANDDLRKNTFLQSLKDQNWTLYYSLLARHLKELVPIVYTPTQAEAIANYSHLFRRSNGLYLTLKDKDTMEHDFLEQTRGREIDLIVCTDAEAILGIGDQGVGGIGISTAKSVMYTLLGGLDPAKSLSVMLDVGTDNKTLLDDPLYVGWPHKRVRGQEYDEFMDNFLQLVRKYYPHSLLHFEDFGVTNAHRLLDRYKDTHAVFNDDIQGTGAVTLACVMAAIGVASRGTKSKTKAKLSDQRYVILGAGSAGMGIAVQMRDAMMTADNVSREQANRKFWLVDRDGLLYDNPNAGGGAERKEFLRPASEGWGGSVPLLETVQKVKPTVLIGCSTSAGAFSKEVVKAMVEGLANNEGGSLRRPIIMPLSNPSRLVEATPKDLLEWTKGRALVATGSPFGTVKMKVGEKNKEFRIAECNNALIYPGLGFGTILAKSRRLTDTMIVVGAQRLAALSPAIRATSPESKGDVNDYDGESLLPDFGEAPRVSFEIGVAVAEQAVREGSTELGQADFPNVGDGQSEGELRESMVKACREMARRKAWVPVYQPYTFDEKGLK